MRSSPRARAAFLLLYGALLAWQIDRWLFTAHGIVTTWTYVDESLLVSTASPTGVIQTFTMGADGLDGVWLRPVVRGGPARGDLLVDLMATRDDHSVRLERVVVSAADAARRHSLRVAFRPVRASRGRQYAVEVRHVHFGDGPAIHLSTTRDDRLPAGRLIADGIERWGDLVFETSSGRATLLYWMHEVLRPWPAWSRTWPVIALVLLAFNVLLAWACAVATGTFGVTTDEHNADEPEDAVRLTPAPSAVRRLALALVWCIAAGGIILAARPTGRYRALDLIEAVPDARIQTTWPSLHAGISLEPVVIFGRVHRAIIALPTSVIRWQVDVPREAVLRFGAAMRPDMWDREGDGIVMRVSIEAAGTVAPVAEYTLVPMQVELHKRLHPGEVPLGAWAGQRITIVLETTPERWGNAVNDVPVWTAPRIEWPRNPAAGTARIIQNSQ